MKKMLIACVAAVAAVCGFADGGETTGETTDTTTETTTETTAVGVNFCSSQGADTAKALFECTWTNDETYASHATTAGTLKLFDNDCATLTFTCANAWERGSNTSFLNAYLDDGGSGISITCTGIPFDYYDVVIYYASDNDTSKFTSPTVNGVRWTFDANNPSVAKRGSDNWGTSVFNEGACGYGTNVLRVVGRTGDLTITSSASGGVRGSIAAIQIIKSAVATMTVGGESATEKNWSETSIWTEGVVGTNGAVNVTLQGDAAVTINEDVVLGTMAVTGGHVLTLKTEESPKVAVIRDVRFSDGGALVLANEAITVDFVNAVVTNTFQAQTAILARANGNVYTAGAGAADSFLTLPRGGGSITFTGGKDKTYYVKGDHSYTDTTFVYDNTTVNYGENAISVGIGNYTLNDATVTTKTIKLSDGADGRTSIFTMNGSSSVTVTGDTNGDSNQSSIMFGHWNGPSTFTMNDTSTFTASNAQVLVGLTKNNQTINMNGGMFTAKGIKLSSNAMGTNKLNFNGGTLALGDVGITTYNSGCTMTITVGGDAPIKATDATLPISQAIVVNADKTLKIEKDAANTNETVLCTLSGAISGAGTIAFGTNVNVNLSTARCAANDTVISVLDTAKVSASLAYGGETFSFKIPNFKKDNFTLYDMDGVTKIDAIITTAGDVVTIREAIPVFTVGAATASFGDTTCWSTSMAETSGDITITKTTTEDATITVPSACVFTNIYIVGSGKVTFKYESGATLNAEGATVALQLSDLTLVIDGVANTSYAEGYKNTITGVGKVETYGNVKMTKDSSFTGGITAKSGTLSTTMAKGYGGVSDDVTAGTITVENGATVDLANTADRCYSFVIAGTGVATTNEDGSVSYAGAIKNSGGTIGRGVKQTRSITLAGDALITVDSNHEWGILRDTYYQTTLNLAGYTLTKQGAGSFFLCNTQGSAAGTIIIAEGTNETCRAVHGAPSLPNATIKMMPGTTLDLNAGLTVATVQLYPQTTGVTINNKGNLTGTIKLDATGFLISEAEAVVDKTYTLVTGTKNTITNGFATVSLGSRVKTDYAADGTALTATIQTLKPFLHYDFNQESIAAANVSSDSEYAIKAFHDGETPTLIKRGKTGTSAKIFFINGTPGSANRFNPYFSELSAVSESTTVKQFFHAGVLSATTVARVMCAPSSGEPVVLWGLGASQSSGGSDSCIGLVAVNETTVALASLRKSAIGQGSSDIICKVENIKDLTTAFHFFAIVVDGTSAKLYVDKLPPVEATISASVANNLGTCGQFGGTYYGNPEGLYQKVNSTGYYLDDWAVYDAALFESEVNALRKKLLPDPFVILVK